MKAVLKIATFVLILMAVILVSIPAMFVVLFRLIRALWRSL